MRSMVPSRLRSAFLGGLSTLSAVTLVSLSTVAGVQAAPGSEARSPVLLQTQPVQISEYTIPPGQLGSRVTDISGVLAPEQFSALEDLIHEFMVETGKSIFIVYMPSFGGHLPMEWAKQTNAANGAGNTLIVAIATEERQYGMGADVTAGYWSDPELDAIEDAMFPSLVDSDWPGVAFAAVEGATASSRASQEAEASGQTMGNSFKASEKTADPSAESNPWAYVLLLAVLIALFGVVLFVYFLRVKRVMEKELVTVRTLSPSEIAPLSKLSTRSLGGRAEEVFVVTAESARSAREQLNLAITELGEGRTRPFIRALNNTDIALQQAIQAQPGLQFAITDGELSRSSRFIRALKFIAAKFQSVNVTPEIEAGKRRTFVDIISSCGLAREKLEQQVAVFAGMRDLLINADAKLDELTQLSISLRTRITPAQAILSDLKGRYAPAVLEPVIENLNIATANLDEVEQQLNTGRELQSRPPGEQGQLVNVLQETEQTLHRTDLLLRAIEQADEDITVARERLQPLINEISKEIRKASDLKENGTALGAQADWDALDESVSRTSVVIGRAHRQAAINPLRVYSDLVETEAQLRDQMSATRKSIATQERQLAVVDSQLAKAQFEIQAAENVILSQTEVAQDTARMSLSKAKILKNQGIHYRTTQPYQAAEYAGQAFKQAQEAEKLAQSAITKHQEKIKAAIATATATAAAEQAKELKKERRSSYSSRSSSSFSSNSSRSSSRSSNNDDRGTSNSGFSGRGGSF